MGHGPVFGAYAIVRELRKVIKNLENKCSHTRDNEEVHSILERDRSETEKYGVEISKNGHTGIKVIFLCPIRQTMLHKVYHIVDFFPFFQDFLEIEQGNLELAIEGRRPIESGTGTSDLVEHAALIMQAIETQKVNKGALSFKRKMGFSPVAAKAIYWINTLQSQRFSENPALRIRSQSLYEMDKRNDEIIDGRAITPEMLIASFEAMKDRTAKPIEGQISSIILEQIKINTKTENVTRISEGGLRLGATFETKDDFETILSVTGRHLEKQEEVSKLIMSTLPGTMLDDFFVHPMTENMGIKIIDTKDAKLELILESPDIYADLPIEHSIHFPDGERLLNYKMPKWRPVGL